MNEVPLRFALVGAGFWSQYHLAAWQEIAGAECVAVCDREVRKAQELAGRFSISQAYDCVEEMLETEKLDFVDIVTDVDSHVPVAMEAIRRKVAVICQKPLAPQLSMARQLCDFADATGVPLLVHENWRWQAPLRRLKVILDSGELGTLVRARIDYANSFPVFDNQPALKELKQFIITDIGTHILDVSRFLFGEASQLYCQTRRIREDIAGEDVATVMIRKESGLTVTNNMSYASRWELDRFPQTMVAVEGTQAGVSLLPDFRIRLFSLDSIREEQVELPKFSWSHPEYELIHSSMVACQENLLSALRDETPAETTGRDNLRTLELVFGAYSSAESGQPVCLPLADDAFGCSGIDVEALKQDVSCEGGIVGSHSAGSHFKVGTRPVDHSASDNDLVKTSRSGGAD